MTEIKKELIPTKEELLYLFLLNMNLLTPEERHTIIRILDTLVGLPIEIEYVKK